MTADTIRRLITNQKAEHFPHAFRAGAAGMADFNQLYPVLRHLPADELEVWLQLIDAMRATHGECVACVCKILAYQMLATRERLPERSARYAALYADLYRRDKTGRDFLAEVNASLHGRPDGPAAERHKQGWQNAALELALADRAIRD